MDRSRKSRNDRSPRCPAEVPRRQRCAPRRANIAVKNFGSILALTMLTAATVSSTHVPDKYPIEVYHMLREKTQFALGRDNRIRGTWGPWSSWSECSRTCGTGIQSQSRECVPYQRLLRKRSIISENGTSNSRPICIGTYKRYHTCNTQKCPNFPEDLRAEQCAKYNGRNYKGESYDWVPFLDAPNSCALNCRAVGEPFYATLEPAVMDGTPCDAPNLRGYNAGISMERTDRWLCVAGQCKPVGCDGVVGSGVTMDACGVCGGQGKGCRLYEGIFMEPILPRGHQPVTSIPKGAMSLNISELRHSSNFLALRDGNGSYILNGPLAYSPSGTYKAAGTTLTYQRGDRNRMECILATGPLNDSLHLEILAQEMNPGVLYKYMMPFNGKPLIAPPLFATGSIDRGNEIPDSDARVGFTIPVNRISNQKIDLLPAIRNQDRARGRERGRKEEMKHSPTTVMAGDQPKLKGKKKKRARFAWKMFGLTPCSKECGGGVQTAIFKCFRETKQMIVNDKRCRNVGKPQHPPPLRCNDNPCPPRWRAEPWGECSVTCGTGTRTRKLECVQELKANLTMRVLDGACVQPPDLRTVETCAKPSCTNSSPELRHMHSQHDTPRWDVGAWGPCSTTCGIGIRNRTVTCITSGSVCPAFNKPESQKICESPPCITHIGMEQRAPWLYSEWSAKCSAECGSGVETRQVACADVSELFCNPKERPETERECFGRGTNCDSAKWFTGPWTLCSVSCGVGVQYREVLCVARTNNEFVVLPASNCSSGSRPANEQVCRAAACTPTWFTSDWSKCSVTCGTGVQTRLVRCILEGVSSSNCEDAGKPSDQQQCSLEPCKKDATSSIKPPKKAYEASSECVDKHPDCSVVVKNGYCRIKYYKYSCCRCRE